MEEGSTSSHLFNADVTFTHGNTRVVSVNPPVFSETSSPQLSLQVSTAFSVLPIPGRIGPVKLRSPTSRSLEAGF